MEYYTFKHFTFGNEVNIITDHMPLVFLLKKSLAAYSSRLSRLILKIVDYPLKMMYQLGRKMVISDALSRVSSYRMAQKYRIIEHFFPKYRTNIGHFSQNIGQI